MIDKTVIVGHGPSIKGCGEYIDSFRYAIRFPAIFEKLPKDFGTRTTFYCSTNARAPLLAEMPLPQRGYFTWSKYSRFSSVGEDMTELICSWQARLPKSAYPFISHGTAGIIIAAAKLEKPIIALGCDALSTGELDSTKYKRADGRTYRKTDRWHSFDEERKLINIVAEEFVIDIKFK